MRYRHNFKEKPPDGGFFYKKVRLLIAAKINDLVSST